MKQAVAKRANVASDHAPIAARAAEKEPLRVAKGEPTKWMPRVDLTGTLKPWRAADVGFETGGRLVRVSVSIDDKVETGQVLAVLDASRAAAQVRQAESQVSAAQASLALAQDTLKRTEALAATKSVPEAQAEQARQQVALAKAQLDGALASTRLAKTGAGLHSISAPFPGIVTRAPTGIGSVVNPGVPLVHVEDRCPPRSAPRSPPARGGSLDRARGRRRRPFLRRGGRDRRRGPSLRSRRSERPLRRSSR